MASIFKVNPKNQLGLEHNQARNKLLKVALAKPEDYFDARAVLINSMTEKLVQDTYDTFWNALTEGKIPKAGGGTDDFEVGGAKFEPRLPESSVNKFALKASHAIMEICEEAVESIMPLEYKDLAISRAKNKLEARAI